jgi:uncharacterized protein (TIGR03663 family)
MIENCKSEHQCSQPRFLGLSVSEWIWLSLIWICGLLLRWIGFDQRPVHHDESLHLMYGRYFFDWPDQQFYRYDPMLHGPLLYNMLRAAYDTFGSSTWGGRALTVFIGSLMMFTPIFFRRYFSSFGFLVLSAAFALSPSFIYWSRFIREDTPQMFLMIMTAVGIFFCKGPSKAYVILISIALQFCGKENSFVCLALLFGYLIYEFILSLFHKSGEDLTISRIGKYCKENLAHVVLAVALSVLVYCYFYTAGFRYTEGILDGLYRKSLAYWFDQHKVQRIVGPFLFHFFNLSWYETVFSVFSLLALVLFYVKADKKVTWLGLGILLLSIVVYIFEAKRFAANPSLSFETAFPWKYAHLKLPIEIISLFILLLHPIICTTVHMLRSEKALAVWGYFFWASYFTYSYLGEKVPWLSIYVLLPGIPYLVLFLSNCFSKESVERMQNLPFASFLRWIGVLLLIVGLVFVLENPERDKLTIASNDSLVLIAGILSVLVGYLDLKLKMFGTIRLVTLTAAICLIFTLRHAYMTNFTHAGSEVEYFSQVHTNKKFHDFALDVRRRAEIPTESGVKIKILSEGDTTWPATWYFVDLPEYKFSATEEEKKGFDFMFIDYKQGSAVPEGFCAIVLPLRSWFVPEWEKYTLKNYLIYTFNRRPWSGTGSTYATALVKNDQWQKCARVVP